MSFLSAHRPGISVDQHYINFFVLPLFLSINMNSSVIVLPALRQRQVRAERGTEGTSLRDSRAMIESTWPLACWDMVIFARFWWAVEHPCSPVSSLFVNIGFRWIARIISLAITCFCSQKCIFTSQQCPCHNIMNPCIYNSLKWQPGFVRWMPVSPFSIFP